ncbi:hypothetical protein, partial [Brachyspira hyodysenteriae]|uniref:hypothetical protein n=1 Tax=Brachyspira hyodysenteriae TaxID=159 RepID=UPI0018EF3850
DDNSPTKKATGGGLPVEVWTRFMKVAHDNVPVVDLPGSQMANDGGGGFLSNFFQGAARNSGQQVSPPPRPAPQSNTASNGGFYGGNVSQSVQPAQRPYAPSPSYYPNARPQVAQTSARPEA